MKECKWLQIGDDYNTWETSCDNEFCLDSGTLSMNGMNYCCYCGEELIEQLEE